MAENDHLSDNEEFLSPVKNEPSHRECTPPPRQKKHRIKRKPTHQVTCPKNPSRRLVFSSHDEKDPSPARHCKKKKRKMKHRKSGQSKKQKFEGRNIEVSGTWVQCTNKDCMKWRYLSEITDPSHVPDIWTCEMNSDSSYNSCLLPEQDYSSLEFVHAKFTEGSLVWAKMQGFPWWPAMIEEDPDSELCLYPDPFTGYVTDYHVVFLDKKVTRCWIKVSNIQKFEGGDCPGSMIVKGHDYSQKIMSAKKIADEAQKLPIQERIKMYGFSARFKGPWGEEEERTSDESQHIEPLKKKGHQPKKCIIIDEDSSLAESLLSHSDMDDILDEAEALLGEVQNIVMEVEDEVQQSLLQEIETGTDEKGSPLQKRKAEGDEVDEPPTKQKKDMSKEKDDGSSSKQDKTKIEKAPKGKMSKELKRIQKKKEKEMHKLELRELKERERIERREKEKQAKKDQRAREKQEKEEKRQKGKQEEKERKEKEKQEQKEKAMQEKKELKQKQKKAKKELKKKEEAEKRALKKALKGETGVIAEGKETEDDAEKLARKEKKRLEKEEKKRIKKEMKAKRKEEKKKEGNDGKAADPKEKGTEKVRPSFQKTKKPTFSAPKQKPEAAAPALPTPTPAEESSVSKEIGALIDEIVSDNDQTSKIASECMMSTTNVPVSADLQASPAKNIKKPFKPKFSIKTKDGQNLSESNLPNCTTSPPPAHASQDGLNALDEEASVDIAKILEVNTRQDSKETTEVDPVKESNSEPLAYPLSQMTGKQLELLPKPGPQEDATDTRNPVNMEEAPSHVPQPTKEIDDPIAESTKILKTLNQPEIQECSPDPSDWSEPDEPQTVPGQKRVVVAAVADGNDSDDSEPFDMEE